MTKDKTIKATKLLGLLCEKGNLNNVQVASFFDNDDDEALLICGELEKGDFLKITRASASKIAGLDKTEKTCSEFNIRISKRNKFILRIKKIHKIILWIIGGIIFLLTAIGLTLDNFDRLTKYLKEKESKPKQEEVQKQQDNILKSD